MDLPGLLTDLSRPRAHPDYDDLTDAEHVAVLDAAELLDELRPDGYAFALARDGTLLVTPPARGAAERDTRRRIAALAPPAAYVLQLERWADPLPETCRRCGAPVEQFSPGGHPYCRPCYAVAAELARRRAAGAAVAVVGPRRDGRAS